MKILQVNCVYKKGSTGKITYDIHTELQRQGIDSVVCYGRGEKIVDPGVYKVCGELYSHISHLMANISGIMYGGCWFSTNKLIDRIKKEKPDIVHLHCINGYFVNIYKLIQWLKDNHIHTVLTLHAEFMYTGGCGYAIECTQWSNHTGCGHYMKCPRYHTEFHSYFDRSATMWNRMRKAFSGGENFWIVGVSEWITNRAKISPILDGQNFLTIHNGINLSKFSTVKNEIDQTICKKYGLPENKKIILQVTPDFYNTVKGGKYFLELAERLGKDYQAVVVGCVDCHSKKIISIPFVSNQDELAALYRRASVFVITSVADNYPTVCIEANCCGTPVIGFDVGGVSETIGENLGEVVPLFDVNSMLKAIRFWSEKKQQLSLTEVKQRRDYCASERMTHDYMQLYKKISINSDSSKR